MNISGVILLLCFVSSTAGLIEWQQHSVNLCKRDLYLGCSPSTQLVIRNATYRSENCHCRQQCEKDDGAALQPTSALHELVKKCNGKKFCLETEHLPFRSVSCDCHEKIIDVEYGCVKTLHVDKACGQQQFQFRDSGIVTNHKYPEASGLHRCPVVFAAGDKKYVTVRPLLMELPVEWSVQFCNMSMCVQISLDSAEQIQLKGTSHIRMMHKTEKLGPKMQVKFAFEYEVVDVHSTNTTPKPKTPVFDPSEIGVTKTEEQARIGAMVAGATIPTLLIAIIVGLFIYKTKESPEDEKKLTGENGSVSSSSHEEYFQNKLHHRASIEAAYKDQA